MKCLTILGELIYPITIDFRTGMFTGNAGMIRLFLHPRVFRYSVSRRALSDISVIRKRCISDSVYSS